MLFSLFISFNTDPCTCVVLVHASERMLNAHVCVVYVCVSTAKRALSRVYSTKHTQSHRPCLKSSVRQLANCCCWYSKHYTAMTVYFRLVGQIMPVNGLFSLRRTYAVCIVSLFPYTHCPACAMYIACLRLAVRARVHACMCCRLLARPPSFDDDCREREHVWERQRGKRGERERARTHASAVVRTYGFGKTSMNAGRHWEENNECDDRLR